MSTTINETSIIKKSYQFLFQHRQPLCFFGLITMGIPGILLGFHPSSIPDLTALSLGEKIGTILNNDMQSVHRIYDVFSGRFQFGPLILGGLVTLFLFQAYKGQSINHKDILIEYFFKIPKMLLTSLVVGFCIIGLLLLFIVPGIIYSIFWMFAGSVVLYYNLSGREALKKSKMLVQGRRWKTLGNNIGYNLIIGFLFLIVTIILILGYLGFSNYPFIIAIIDTAFHLIQIVIIIYQALLLGHFFLLRTETIQKKIDTQQITND